MTRRVHTKPKKVCEIETLEVTSSLLKFPVLADRLHELESEGYKFYVVDQNRGYCDNHKRWITIPLWVLRKPYGYWVQCVAHELAHTVQTYHDAAFMREMQRLCPPEFWHFELEYKPEAARSVGIAKSANDRDAGNDVKVSKLIDLL